MPRGRPRKDVKKDIKKETVKYRCTCCNKDKRAEEFYRSKSYLFKGNGLLCICKECVGEVFDKIQILTNSYKLTMYRLCRKLDIPFIHSLYDLAERESNRHGTALYRMYFQKMNSLGSANGYLGDFDDSDEFDKKLDRDFNDVESLKQDLLEDFELSKDILMFWGSGFDVEDYKFLQDEFDDWQSKYEIDSKSLEMLVKEMCYTSLTISKKRIKSESVDKDLKTLQELMASCNLKPVQETGMNANEQATFGTLIKKWENEKPIPEPDPEWKDINNIGKYIRTWFTGHLSRMMGVESGVTEEYLEEISKYTVEEGE